MDEHALKAARLDTAGQARITQGRLMYDMCLKFECDTTISEMDEFTRAVGFAPGPVLPRSLTVKIWQTVPFIPDDHALVKYAEALIGTKQGSFVIRSAAFTGYEYLYAISTEPAKGGDDDA